MPKITISYRRADSEAMTGRIFDRLIAHYGKEAIFRDIDDIPPGIDFRVHINETLRKTHLMLAIVGPQWLGAAAAGLERIQEESDPVRVEVETALRRRLPIIPVLIGVTPMPSAEQLPPSLKDFSFRNAVKVDTGQDFNYHMDRLIRAMDLMLVQPGKPAPSGETKVPQPTPAKASVTAEKTSPLSFFESRSKKKDTGPRPAVIAAPEPARQTQTKQLPFADASPGWTESLWPASLSGRLVRLAIVAVIAVPVVLAMVGLPPFGAGGDSGVRSGGVLVLTGHSAPVSSVAFSPNARTIISGSLDDTVRVWDASSGQMLRKLSGASDAVSSVAFAPNGKWLASGSKDRSIDIWDAVTGQLLRTLRYNSTYVWENPAVWSIAISPNGARITAGSADASIRIWNDATGELVRNFTGHTEAVTAVAYLPDGRTLVSGSKDGTVRLWDADTSRLLRTLPSQAGEVMSVAISPDGKRIAAGSNNAVILWNADTGQQLRTLPSTLNLVEAVSFSPDGKTVIDGGNDTTIEIWNADSGQAIRTFAAPAGGVRALAISADGHRLAAGGDNDSVDVWPIK
jgi:WD40 repeat protein